MLSRPAGAVRLFAADPDLGRGLTDKERAFADRHILADVRSLVRGRWTAVDDQAVTEAHFGLLVLDGCITREARVAGRSSVELLGAGDVLCPDVADADDWANIRQCGVWQAHEPTRFAVITDDVVAGFAGLRQVLGELNRRAIRRSRALALRLAIVDEPQLARRLELLLWHLADRWGRRRGGSVQISAPLTRDLLAKLAGAHPNAVSRALGQLDERGLVSRENGVFALHAEPPTLAVEAA